MKILEVEERFAEEFPTPEFDLKGDMLAPPVTRNYSLVGTAFDYLLRWLLERLNPNCVKSTWVAEEAVRLIHNDPEILRKAERLLHSAKDSYNAYLKSGEVTDDVIKAGLHLAQLDPIYRAGIIDPNLGQVDGGDVADLRNLISVVKPDLFRSQRRCILNPTFGLASLLVGGADADLLLDDRLIDVKTTKNLQLRRRDFNQVIGYYLLWRFSVNWNGSEIGRAGAKYLGLDSQSRTVGKGKLSKLCFYYSRHGLFFEFPTSLIEEKPDLDEFTNWFQGRALREFSDKIPDVAQILLKNL